MGEVVPWFVEPTGRTRSYLSPHEIALRCGLRRARAATMDLRRLHRKQTPAAPWNASYQGTTLAPAKGGSYLSSTRPCGATGRFKHAVFVSCWARRTLSFCHPDRPLSSRAKSRDLLCAFLLPPISTELQGRTGSGTNPSAQTAGESMVAGEGVVVSRGSSACPILELCRDRWQEKGAQQIPRLRSG